MPTHSQERVRTILQAEESAETVSTHSEGICTLTSAAVVLGQNDELGLIGSSDFSIFLFSRLKESCRMSR
jgi:hypothetical protein